MLNFFLCTARPSISEDADISVARQSRRSDAQVAVALPSTSEESVRVYGSLGTLYCKCGGVFGVSSFVDRCMDKWMADATLNSNDAVATWHLKAQRCGFKFLVVQIVCNLTGGPQAYTGRPMDVAHKHLNITDDQWAVFMELFNEVCTEFGLHADTIDDLNALMISMESDCVIQPGERVPRDPGAHRPAGSSLYARMGGVYPMALFADRLVDALLSDERVCIPCDTQKRNEASLKYLFTELMCNACGGPEVVTARGHGETMLLLPASAWSIFVETAKLAADHLPAATRSSLIQVLEQNRKHIVDPSAATMALQQSDMGAAVVKDMRAAAAGKMLTKEAVAARHAAPGAMVAARKRVYGDPRTLYGRGGGVFGLAKLADSLMDEWMADSTLNANTKVARWHNSNQKCGFKFLVTQIMGYLTGGPQRYTGRPMEESHKHLEINAAQWDTFMRGASKVFAKFQIDGNTSQELLGILANYRSACVLAPGEAAPADPGLMTATGRGTTLYQRLGGVYPIAQFADRLVESVLKGNRIRVDYDRLDDMEGKRHPPGLKYMVTELICHAAGGPEVVTSKGFDEAKLGVSAEDWPTFLQLAAEAAELWSIPHLRNSLVTALGSIKAEICIGIIEDDASADAQARRLVQQAGFDHYLTSAALEHAKGDASAALELLAKGWHPINELGSMPAGAGTSVSSAQSLVDGDAGRGRGCPFGFDRQSVATPPLASYAEPTVDDRLTEAAQKMAEQGMSPSQIAQLLGLQESAVKAVVAKASNGDGKVLGNRLQEQLDELLQEDPDLCCPVSLVLFVDPVIASDGFMYEKASLDGLLRANMASPMTRERLKKEHLPARQRKSAAIEFRERRAQELVKFAEKASGEIPHLATTALERVGEYLEVLQPAKCRGLVKDAANVWRKLGKPVPAMLSCS